MALPLLVLLPLMLSFETYEAITGGVNGATVQKAVFVVATIFAGWFLGYRMPPWPLWGMAAAVAAGYIVALVMNVRAQTGFDTGMLFGAIGLIYPWLVFFVDWRPVSIAARGMAIGLIAPLTVAVSSALQLIWPEEFALLKNEYTGAVRLAAGLPPAYLGGLALVGMCASLWLWNQRRWYGLYLAALNVGILALTGTRGATACAAAVFLVMLVVAIVRRFPHWIAALGCAMVGVVLGATLILPTFLERSAGAATGSGIFSGSGRGAAWGYFVARIGEMPWSGYGPGSGGWLAEQSSNRTVREYFVSPHNEYLRFAADIGVPLTIIFFAALVILLTITVRKARSSQRVFIISACGALLLYAVFDNLLNAPQSAIAFALLVACLWNEAMSGALGLDDVPINEPVHSETVHNGLAAPVAVPVTPTTRASLRRDHRSSKLIPRD